MATILVVDDDQQHCNMTAQLPRLLGHQVSLANSGADALAGYRRQPMDLVITDILMPGTDGIELILAGTCSVAWFPAFAGMTAGGASALC